MAKSIGQLLKSLRKAQAREYKPNKKDDPLYVEYGEIMTCGDKWLIDCIDYNGEFAAQEGKTLVSIIRSAHEVVYVITEGKQYSSEFTGTIGAEFTTSVVPDEGYSPGTANPESGVISEGLVITVSPAGIQQCTVSVVQSEHQHITLLVDGNEVTEGNPVTVPYGATYSVSITADGGYTPGTLNYPEAGSVTGDMEVYATEATLATYTISMFTSDEANETVSVWIPDVATGTEYTSSIEGVQYGTKYEVVVHPNEGYIAGELTCDRVGTVTDDLYISVGDAYTADNPPQRKALNGYILAKGPNDSDKLYIGSQNNIKSGTITSDALDADEDPESNLQSVLIRYVEAEVSASKISLNIHFGYVDTRYDCFTINLNDAGYLSDTYDITRDGNDDGVMTKTIDIDSSSSLYGLLNNLFTNANHNTTDNTVTMDIKFAKKTSGTTP